MVFGHTSHDYCRPLAPYSARYRSDCRKGSLWTIFTGNTIRASYPGRRGRKTTHGCYFEFLESDRRCAMKMTRSAVLCSVVLLLAAPMLRAQDFSKYRNFSLGTNLAAILKQTDQRSVEVKATHDGSVLFQELTWHPTSGIG